MDYLMDKYGSKIKEFFGASAGFTPGDWGGENGLQPYKYSKTSGSDMLEVPR